MGSFDNLSRALTSFHSFNRNNETTTGQDGEGNYVPSKKLREKFKRERKDVYWSDGKGDSDDPSEN